MTLAPLPSSALSFRQIPISAPRFIGNESKYVQECIDSTWVSSIGRFIPLFEDGFARFCNVPHAIAANNGTSALHLALLGCNVQAGDEVIVPALTFVATANAVAYCGAKPVFVDSEPRTMNLDPALRKNISFEYYEAGHMMYIDTRQLKKLHEDEAAFISASLRK